jgi:hypothetical protein
MIKITKVKTMKKAKRAFSEESYAYAKAAGDLMKSSPYLSEKQENRKVKDIFYRVGRK